MKQIVDIIKAIGTLAIGIGTLLIGYAAISKIPKAAEGISKAIELSYRLQRDIK